MTEINGMDHPLVESRPTPTFCDVCNKIAYGILLQCKTCGLICHKQCQIKIQFHCESDSDRTVNSGRNQVTSLKFPNIFIFELDFYYQIYVQKIFFYTAEFYLLTSNTCRFVQRKSFFKNEYFSTTKLIIFIDTR